MRELKKAMDISSSQANTQINSAHMPVTDAVENPAGRVRMAMMRMTVLMIDIFTEKVSGIALRCYE
jgi:hypothetical protein